MVGVAAALRVAPSVLVLQLQTLLNLRSGNKVACRWRLTDSPINPRTANVSCELTIRTYESNYLQPFGQLYLEYHGSTYHGSTYHMALLTMALLILPAGR